MRPLLITLLLALIITPTITAEPVSQEAITRMRHEARERERRIIFDNDGNEPVYYCDEATPEALLSARTAPLAGTQVDTIFYCTWSSGFGYFTHDTEAGWVFDTTAPNPEEGPGSGFATNKTAAFHEKGLDPLTIMVDWCKAHDIEIFWTMRMNDIHDAWGAWYSPFLFPPFKEEHPEYLAGTKENRPMNGGWSAVDFTIPEVRDMAFAFFDEVCTNYDVDGVQLDFFRHLNYFRSHAWNGAAGDDERALMTNLLRRIRRMADEKGAERGRPILLSVRVPDSVELARLVGLDIERWLEEDLIDLLVVSGYFRLNPWEKSVELGHKYGVPVYPCLSESRVRDAAGRKLRASDACYRGRAANVWASGADGVYMFNFFNPDSPLWNELGSVDTLRPREKTYVTAARGLGNLSFWHEGGAKFLNRDLLTPDSTRTLEPGGTVTIAMPIGLPPADEAEATLVLVAAGLQAADALSVRVNDTGLNVATADDDTLRYAIPAGTLVKGANTVTFTLEGNHNEAPILRDLWVQMP